jgi:hypothetical protein
MCHPCLLNRVVPRIPSCLFGARAPGSVVVRVCRMRPGRGADSPWNRSSVAALADCGGDFRCRPSRADGCRSLGRRSALTSLRASRLSGRGAQGRATRSRWYPLCNCRPHPLDATTVAIPPLWRAGGTSAPAADHGRRWQGRPCLRIRPNVSKGPRNAKTRSQRAWKRTPIPPFRQPWSSPSAFHCPCSVRGPGTREPTCRLPMPSIHGVRRRRTHDERVGWVLRPPPPACSGSPAAAAAHLSLEP